MAASWQNIPSGSTTTSTSAPAPSAPASAPAAHPEAGLFGNSTILMLLMFVPLILLMLWQSRSQKKQQEKLLADIKKGDMILLSSGIRGKLMELGDRFAKVEIAPGTKIEVLKNSILGKDSAEAAAQLDKR